MHAAQICLAYPLPTLGPPSRVEMTSSEIFVPTLAAFFPPAPSPSPSPSSALDLAAAAAAADEPPARLASAFAAMQRAVPPGRSPLSFRWETLDRTSRLAAGPPSLLDAPHDPDGLSSRVGGREADDEARERLRARWEDVLQAAAVDGIEGDGGSDAFAVWDFAPRREDEGRA